MEMSDDRLCSLAFQEYVSRRRVLELKLKMQQETNDIKRNYIEQEIDKLRNEADVLNSLRQNNYEKTSNLLTK